MLWQYRKFMSEIIFININKTPKISVDLCHGRPGNLEIKHFNNNNNKRINYSDGCQFN